MGHEAGPQSGLGVGCARCPSSKKTSWAGCTAQARRKGIYFSLYVAGVSSFYSSFAQSDEAWRVEVQ